MNIQGLLGRYKDFKPAPERTTLFDIDLLDAVVKHVCPYHGTKLYEMRNRPYWFCKSKRGNKCGFIISSAKLK